MAGGNNGQEVSHRYNHGATGGNKKNISLTYFLANLSKFMADYSERLAARSLKHDIPHTSLQSKPELTCARWDLLQRLDVRTLMVTYCPDPAKPTAFTEMVRELEARLRSEDNLYDIIDRCSSRNLVASKDLITVCVPSQALLRELDPDKTKSVAELRAAVLDQARPYLAGLRGSS